MEKKKKLTSKKVILILAAIFIICGGAIIAMPYILDAVEKANKVASTEDYGYVNPDESKADADEGFKIDGVFDEEVYQKNRWLYLENKESGADCNIAMTSYFGEKGMYFAYDVDEGTPINVNPERPSYLNSCIEMYLSPGYNQSLWSNGEFEIDLMPTGDIIFKTGNGHNGWTTINGSNDIMAYLGAVPKGGPVNSEKCNGYTLELFIPWTYLERWGVDVEAVKDSYVAVNPAHITSFNYAGTDLNVDRYHYWFAQQIGGSWDDVATHFRFDKNGAQDTVLNEFVQGDHYTIKGPKEAIPGMKGTYMITPEKGYAITSFVVNEKEYIKDVNFLEDGTAVLTTREKVNGLKISGVAEVVTGGKKTLTGTLSSNRLGNASIQDTKLTYKGKRGVQVINYEANGKFTVTNLEPGYYTISAEKEGYKKVTRTIYLNRDMDINVVLDYDRFETIEGSAWILDEQNNNVLMRFGGGGGAVILTKDSYTDVSIRANFAYDVAASKTSTSDALTQQRQGYRMVFSNEKVIHADLLFQDNEYFIQLAEFSGKDKSVFHWNKAYVLTPAEIAKYQSEGGIQFEMQRSGRLVNFLLDGRIVANEYLDAEFEKLTAKVGFESWVGKREVVEVPYEISQKKISANGIFKATQGWDISKQNQGILTVTGKSDGNEDASIGLGTLFSNYRDISMKIRDAKNDGKFALAYRFQFANGEEFAIRLQNLKNSSGTRDLNIQIMGVWNTIIPDWKTVSGLSDAQKEKLFAEGLDFRVAIINESAHVYLDGTEIGVLDLSKHKDGTPTNIKNVPARIMTQLYGNGGVTVEVPFNVSEVALGIKKSMYGTVTANKTRIKAGDTVVLTARNDDNTVCKQIKIDGKVYPLDANGQISFKAQASGHTIEGIYNKKEIFKSSATWDITKESSGVISTVGRSVGDYIATADNNYRQVSMTAKDLGKDGKFSMCIQWEFTNGRRYAARITTHGQAVVQVMGAESDNTIENYHNVTGLTQEQVEKLQSEGLKLTMSLVGSKMYFLLDDRQIGVRDISKDENGIPTNIANDTATIKFRIDGNEGQRTDVTFDLQKVAIVNPPSNYGTVVTDKASYLTGETVTVTSTNKDGSPSKVLIVDGRRVALNAEGKYSFTAERGHVLEGVFEGEFFSENTSWDLTEQENGILKVTGANNIGPWVTTKKNTYRGMSLTVRDYNMNEAGFTAVMRFTFTNNEVFVIRLNHADIVSKVFVQTMNSDGNTLGKNWDKVGEDFSQAMREKLWSQGVEFGVYIVEEKAHVYIDGQHWGEYDLSTTKDGRPSNIADETASIDVRIDKNTGYRMTMPFVLNETNISIEEDDNGTVTVDKRDYLLGDDVVIKVAPNEGVFCTGVKVDGELFPLNDNGTCTFEASKSKHVISAVYEEAIFKPNPKWDVQKQLENVVTILKTEDGYSSWLETLFTYTGVEITAKYHNSEPNDYGMALSLKFANDKDIRVRLTNADSDGSVFKLQAMDGSISPWKNFYTLNDDQVAKLKGDGLKFKLLREGTKLDLYLDGNVVVNDIDLTANDSGVTEDMNSIVRICLWGNAGVDTEVPFELLGGKEKVILNIAESANGSVAGVKKTYRVDDDVVLKVTGNNGYACKELRVDGSAVDIAANGTYTFKATKTSYDVEAVFDKAIFRPNGNYEVGGQFFGAVALTNDETVLAGFLNTEKDTYRDVTITAKRADQSDYCMITAFEFTNGEKFVVRLNLEGNAKTIQIMPTDGNTFKDNWKDVNLYTLSEAQAQKVNGEGIDYRVAIIGEKAYFFLDGFLATTYDLSMNVKGEPTNLANVGARIGIRMDGNKKTEVGIPFKLGAEPARVVTPTLAAGENGRLELDAEAYYEGQNAIVTVVPNEGYVLDTLKFDGEVVTPNADGTFAFAITKDDHRVEATFAKQIWTSESTEWNLMNQFKGYLEVTAKTAPTANAVASGNYSQIATTVKYTDGMKDGSGNFIVTKRLTFSNNRYGTAQLILDNTGNLKLKLDGSALQARDKKEIALDAAYAAKIATDGVEFKITRSGRTINYYIDGVQVYTLQTAPQVTASMTIKNIQLSANIAINKTLKLPFVIQ